jgi:adenylate cyclase
MDPTPTVRLNSLEHETWQRLQEDILTQLRRLGLERLAAPTTLILHDLIDGAVSAMHHQLFRRVVESDFGLDLGADNHALEELYKTETSEHGVENIARYCRENDWHVAVGFPQCSGEIAQLEVPVSWNASACGTCRLIEAIGYRLESRTLDGNPDGMRVTLACRTGGEAAARATTLLDERAERESLTRIFGQLGYGLIQFAGDGRILAVSPAMLERLGLETAAVDALAVALPATFHNDVIWGAALDGEHGVFENYRIRVKVPGDGNRSILFNVSGFRDGNSVIHTLWQAVSIDEGGSLSEGSMLSEVRIHNITRNYVPQLVKEKARDAIRLGKNKLTNEVRSVAVLFCDIVGYTHYVETSADSESIIDTLNSILRRVAGSVKRNNGSIDKFMGDAVMALFDQPADALLAACDMQAHAEDINSLRRRAGQQALQLRIGVHWGEVVIGNVGTVERLDWTAIGDVVNTASRIEKGCQPGAILVSQAIRDAVAPGQLNRFSFGEVFRLQVKGKGEQLSVCTVSLAPNQPG